VENHTVTFVSGRTPTAPFAGAVANTRNGAVVEEVLVVVLVVVVDVVLVSVVVALDAVTKLALAGAQASP
jgi:hypothetical protein